MTDLDGDFPLLQRLALPIALGTTHYPGIKIHDTHMIRLMEVLLHGGATVGGWRARDIHHWCMSCAVVKVESMLAAGRSPRIVADEMDFAGCGHFAADEKSLTKGRCGLRYSAVSAGLVLAWSNARIHGDGNGSNRLRYVLRSLRKRLGGITVLEPEPLLHNSEQA